MQSQTHRTESNESRTTTSRNVRIRRATAAALLGIVGLTAACGNRQEYGSAGTPTSVAKDGVPPPSPSAMNRSVNQADMVGVAPTGAGVASRASGERYARIVENPFLTASSTPLSTFSIDVDTASYSNTRRFINDGQLPPADAVRIEELVNYFHYDYPQPVGDAPFSVNTEVAGCPWARDHRLVRIGLKGKDVERLETPARNLVFLVDVSGSMSSPDKLPLVKDALGMLAKQMTARDRIAIVVYAGAAGVVLPSTQGTRTDEIIASLDRLSAGGSTAGGQGIQLAYKIAADNFVEGGVNRVVLASDGDFNVGVSDQASLERLIEEKRRSGISLSILGVGTGNVNDSMMESIADKGNGNYSYLDSREEARKVLVEQVGGTLVTIAKDVKIQVEFNPGTVAAYRLIGYENRALANQDFDNDSKDAGEIGAGHTVTALYEVVPAGTPVPVDEGGTLSYQQPRAVASGTAGELLYVKLRYKDPDGSESKLLSTPVRDGGARFDAASDDFRFAASVAQFGMLLRGSKYRGTSSYGDVTAVASRAIREDSSGYRAEFVSLVRRAESLTGGRQPMID